MVIILANFDYKITVEQNVNVNVNQGTASTPLDKKLQEVNKQNGNPIETSKQVSGKGEKWANALTAQFAVESAGKLLNATGNQDIGSAVSKIGSVVFKGARALSGDPSAILSLAIDSVAEVIKLINEEKVEREEEKKRQNNILQLEKDTNTMRSVK